MQKESMSKEKKKMIIIYAALVTAFLFLVLVYFLINSGKLDRGKGLVGDSVCGNFVGWEAQINCCINIHEDDQVPECIGGWNFNDENSLCNFECSLDAYCKAYVEENRDSCCRLISGDNSLNFNEDLGKCEIIEQNSEELTAEENCEFIGGTWEEFPNGCVDSCISQRTPEVVLCTQAFTYGCECGVGFCFNQQTESCEPV